ncbi:hypothetical protein [Streptomyces griseofuscus]|uniref:hypothetical protein n=1 Tax=Streptomyces griseofuscus TaxID=146922 RepID=UPI003431623A
MPTTVTSVSLGRLHDSTTDPYADVPYRTTNAATGDPVEHGFAQHEVGLSIAFDGER